MRTSLSLFGALTAALGIAATSNAQAQTLAPPATRPAQGLFDRAPENNQQLDLSMLFLSAYDDNLAANDSGGTNPVNSQTQRGGGYDGLTSRVAYSKKFSHGTIAFSEGSSVRYYPSLADIVSLQHAAIAGATVQVQGMRISIGQTLEYLPFFAFANTPKLFDSATAELPPVVGDQAMVRRDQRVFSSSLGVTQQLGGRTSLSANANLRRANFLSESIGQTTKELGARLSRKLTRDLSIVLGYSYQDGVYAPTAIDAVPVRIHNLDVGVDYNHALGRTRRTTIGFTTGSSEIDGDSRGPQRQFTGSARLNREIGRTWHATALYRRGAGFVDGFAQPMFADSVATSIGGTISRRVELALVGNYSKGGIGFGAGSSENKSYNGSAKARIAIARRLVVSAEYFYFRYHFADAAVLPAGVPADVNRQGARIGLELWLPVIR